MMELFAFDFVATFCCCMVSVYLFVSVTLGDFAQLVCSRTKAQRVQSTRKTLLITYFPPFVSLLTPPVGGLTTADQVTVNWRHPTQQLVW